MFSVTLWLQALYLYCCNLNILLCATKWTRQSFDTSEVKIKIKMVIGVTCFGLENACRDYMSHVMRKPDFANAISENKGADQLCSNCCTADQHFCFCSTYIVQFLSSFLL